MGTPAAGLPVEPHSILGFISASSDESHGADDLLQRLLAAIEGPTTTTTTTTTTTQGLFKDYRSAI